MTSKMILVCLMMLGESSKVDIDGYLKELVNLCLLLKMLVETNSPKGPRELSL
jgi:hypothetical protein